MIRPIAALRLTFQSRQRRERNAQLHADVEAAYNAMIRTFSDTAHDFFKKVPDLEARGRIKLLSSTPATGPCDFKKCQAFVDEHDERILAGCGFYGMTPLWQAPGVRPESAMEGDHRGE